MKSNSCKLIGTCCQTCGALSLEKRPSPYEKAAQALLSVAIRIVVGIILSGF